MLAAKCTGLNMDIFRGNIIQSYPIKLVRKDNNGSNKRQIIFRFGSLSRMPFRDT